MRKNLYFVCLFMIAISIFCKKAPTSVTELKPGSRNYVWEVDTLNMPMNYLDSVWGASPNDVWAIGGVGSYQDRLQHYDGVKWTPYTKEAINVGGYTLWGFSANNIWLGGQGGWGVGGAAIWHYDGVRWTQNYVYDVEGSYLMEVRDIWGANPKDIYACGLIVFVDGKTTDLRGFVLHYDGKRWREVLRADFDSEFHVVRKERESVYVFSTKYIRSGGGLEFYEIKDNKLRQMYSGPQTQGIHLCDIQGKVFFIMGHDICRYIDGAFVKQYSINLDNFGNYLWGRHENDQFIRMTDGIAHYNGTDIEYIYSFPQLEINIADAVLLEKDVFFCDYRNNLVIHGRLKE